MSEAISVLNPSKPRKHGKHKARRKLSGTSVVMVPSGGRYVAGHVVKNNPAHKRRRIKLRRNPAADMKGAALGAVGVLLVLGADAAVHKFIPETMLGKARGFIAPAVGLAGGFLGAGFVGPAVAAGKLYILDHKGAEDVVRAVDTAKGLDVWSFPYPDAPKSSYGFARSTPARLA